MKVYSRLINYFFASIIGFSIPIFFAYLDMWELEIDTNFSNLSDMVKSQNVYVFSGVCFPLIFIILSELLYKVKAQNDLIRKDFDFLKIILNATPDAIVFLNEEQEIIFQNNQFKLLFSDFQEVIDSANLFNYFNQVEYIQKEIYIDSNISDAHPFLMNFKLTTLNNQKNYFVSLKDLKNLKDKERIIETQNHQMIEKNKLASMGEMAAGIAHEINNPLTVIHSNNSLVLKLAEKNSFDIEKIKKITSKTREQVERITNIIRSLRNLSRGLANEDLEHFDIGQVVEESISLAKMRDKGRKIEFHFDSSEVWAFGNRGQIVQVILNLLNNAIDAIEIQKEPWIKIDFKQKAEVISLFIIDSGEGIETEVLNKIFMPMYTTKGVGKGTGLGLSLSRTFIEQNGGTLDYFHGKGNTCFKITLRAGEKIVSESSETDNSEAA